MFNLTAPLQRRMAQVVMGLVLIQSIVLASVFHLFWIMRSDVQGAWPEVLILLGVLGVTLGACFGLLKPRKSELSQNLKNEVAQDLGGVFSNPTACLLQLGSGFLQGYLHAESEKIRIGEGRHSQPDKTSVSD